MQARVQLPGKEVVLVGTAHVSAESASEVRAVIDEEEPDIVAVELDEHRYEALTHDTHWKELDIQDALKQGKGSLLLLNIVLSIYQRRLGEELDVTLGSEMLAAIDAAEVAGVPYALIDRDVQDTMRDAMQQLTLWEKYKLLAGLIAGFFNGEQVDEELVEQLKQQDMLTALVDELGDAFPSIKHVFLDIRDAYMAEQLRQLDAEKVVAVVGAAHVAGMKQHLEAGTRVPVQPVEQRSRFRVTTALKYGVPGLIIAMFLYILLFIGVDAATNAAGIWFLANGALAAAGALLAKAHPLTVIIAFLAAPFTSLNPALPSGLVAAYTEHRLRPPKVGDLEAIGNVSSYRALWSNGALKLLLIFFLVNLGSAIASYGAGGYLATVIAG